MVDRRSNLDLQILFILSVINMWIAITIYFDFSHVYIYSLFMARNNKFNDLF